MKVKFTMPQNSGLRADFNTDEYHTIATKAELNAEIEARIEGDSTLQSEITRVENEIPDISGLATKAELQEVENEIPDISGLATKTELQAVENEIPTKTSQLTNDSGYITDVTWSDVANKPNFATVATSGNYNDLNNKPVIPIVNNPTITFTQGGTTKGTITLNQVANQTIDFDAGGGGGAVDSVNGQTGDVVLTASDVGALPNTTVIPTKTSDLTNDSGFITKTVNNLTNYYLKSETYTKLEVQQLITSIPKFTVVVVQALPVTGQSMTLYLLPKDGEAPDVYEEYIWVTETETYELIGSTAVDLDGYATEDWVEAKGYATETFVNDGLATKQDILTAGTDLEIVTGSGGDSTVSGTTSIALNGASANGLNSVTLTGACVQNGTPTPETPINIVCNNGAMKVSKNLFDKETLTDGYISDDGNISASTASAYSDFIPVMPNTTYVLSGATLYSGNSALRIHGYSAQKTWSAMIVKIITQSAPEAITSPIVFTTGNSDYFIRFSYGRNNILGVQIEAGSTATTYKEYKEIYTDGTVETVTDSNQSTATAEMLLSVGNYKDTQSILNGAVTRNVGVKILDGSEEWNAITNNRGYYLMINCVQDIYTKVYGICSHFNFYIWADNTTQMPDNNFGFNKSASTGITNGNITFKPNLTDIPTVEAWKAFLANEYVSGTPVIVVYPLATPTTETVTGQTLTTVQGNNTLTITQASIENLPIEANYNLQGGKIINFTNDSGYTTNEGTVTSVNNVQPDTNGNVTLNIDNAISTTSTNLVQNKAIPSYIVSRGENLVSNGFATLGNNYNFSTMTYTGADTYGAGGCFYYTNSSNGRVRSDEYMPIDITQSYKLSYAVKNTTLTSTYDFIDMYDIDFNRIAAGNCGFTAGTTTTLARDLKNGDTVIYFTDLSNWNTESTSQYLRALIFWKYKNSYGYEYPTEYYSRYWWYNLWADSSVAIDKVNNTITLSSGWTHGSFSAGHPVSQGTLSGANVYGNSGYKPTPNEWTVKTYTFDPSKYRNATAYIQLGWLTNYSNVEDNTFSISSIAFTSNVGIKEFNDTCGDIETALNTIRGV